MLTPSYGSLHKLDGATRLFHFDARFRGETHSVTAWEVPGAEPGVRNIVLDHPLFQPDKPGVVYHGEEATGPYAIDGDKFAFYCSAAASYVEACDERPAAVHLHDWHAGVYAVLRRFDSSYPSLADIPTVFTIHNLSYQGQRPLDGNASSLKAWFPELEVDPALVADPADDDVFNPMAAAIRLADRVNTVSPTYAEEIVNPSDEETGFIGGEGLEDDLARRRADSGLIGILNGCDYRGTAAKPPGWQSIVDISRRTVEQWNSRQPAEVHDIALDRIARLPKRRPLHLLASVGRVVAQKMRLFLEPTLSGSTALEDILANLGDRGVLLLLGSGDAIYEEQLIDIAAANDNLVYFNGYSEALGDVLYAGGDLFLMPSSFEPCGISQMLAMRNGQPCVVHGVGGLYDTVEDGVNGFVFDGRTPLEQADGFVECVDSALKLRRDDPLHWQTIKNNAKAARFDWASAATNYVRLMYEFRSV